MSRLRLAGSRAGIVCVLSSFLLAPVLLDAAQYAADQRNQHPDDHGDNNNRSYGDCDNQRRAGKRQAG